MYFYYQKTKKVNGLLLFTFGSVLIGEFLVSKGFLIHFETIYFFFLLFFVGSTILLYPMFKETKLNLHRHSLISVFIGAIGLIAILLSTYFFTIDYVPEYSIFIADFASLSIFVITCFFISHFSKHPKSFYLFIVGACYMVVTAGALAYETVFPSVVLLGITNVSEVLAQYFFVYFLIEISFKTNYEELPL